jgi:hypothetical protein
MFPFSFWSIRGWILIHPVNERRTRKQAIKSCSNLFIEVCSWKGKIGACTLYCMCSLGENGYAETAVMVAKLHCNTVVL